MEKYGNFKNIKMAFYGIPKEDGGDSEKNDSKMEDCVAKVMAKGHDKESAIKICKTSLGFTKDSAEEGPDIDPEATVPCAHCGVPVSYQDVQAAHVEDAKIPVPWEPRGTGRQMVRHTRWDSGIVAPEHPHCNNSKNYFVNVIMDEHASEEERKHADSQLRNWYGDRSEAVHPFAHTGDWPPHGPEETDIPPRKKSGDPLTLGGMINGAVDRLHALRGSMLADRDSGMAPDDVVNKYAYKSFRRDDAAKHDRQSVSGPQLRRLKKGFFSEAWRKALTPQEKTSKDYSGKEASVETNHISESGPTPIQFIPREDHEGKLAIGINPATCEICSAPMELHSGWETNKQTPTEPEWFGPEDTYNTIVSHLEDEHEIVGFGKYASPDDDLLINYVKHLHKLAHRKESQFLNQDLIKMTDHPPLGDAGTFVAAQLSGKPIVEYAAEVHEKQHTEHDDDEKDFELPPKHTTQDHTVFEIDSSVKQAEYGVDDRLKRIRDHLEASVEQGGHDIESMADEDILEEASLNPVTVHRSEHNRLEEAGETDESDKFHFDVSSGDKYLGHSHTRTELY